MPVRPKPVTTSSAISMTPYLLQISLTIGQYSSPGTAAPFGVPTGSPMKAATVSGLWNSICFSTSPAHFTAHSEVLSAPSSHR